MHAVYKTRPMLSAAPEEALNFTMVVRETAPAYAPETERAKVPEGKRARARRLNIIRAEVQARLAKASVASGGLVAKPRYDDVFAAGVEWLDQLGGEPVAETEGKLTIGQEVWKSDARREPEIP